MTKFNHLALPAVMILLGVLTIIASLLGNIGTIFFPFDTYIGARGSVAGVAFGVGLAVAGSNPVNNLSWIKAGILYCALEVVYEIVAGIGLGGAAFSIIPLAVSIIVGALLIFLYPRGTAVASARPVTPPPAATTRT